MNGIKACYVKCSMICFNMPVIFVDTAQDIQLNSYKFGVQTNIGKQSLPFIVIDIWKDLPFSINSIKHFRSSQSSQTLSTV